MEFIKNFLYDISDSVIKLLVVAVMIFVIAFKLNTAMPDIDVFGYQTGTGEQPSEQVQKEEDNKVISIDLTDSNVNKDAAKVANPADSANAANPTDAQKPQTQQQANAQTQTQTQGDAQAQTQAQTQPKTKTPEQIREEEEAKKKLEAEKVTTKVVIEAGYTSQKIASTLVSAKVIKDSKAFLDVVAELGYTSKLRSGTYYLSSDMTYEEIANKLVGR